MPIRNLNASQKTKHTPAGQIPVEWETVRLQTVGDIRYGLTVNQIRREQAKRLPCVTVSDFRQGRMSAEKAKLVGCLPGDTGKYALEPEDVLVVEGNGNPDIVGRATRWLQSEEGAVLHQNHLLRIRLDRKRILPSLLVDWLNSEGCRRHLRPRIITSSGLNTLNSKSLGGCFVPLPPLPEQRRIAEILSTWDRAIEQTEKLIEAKKRLKKGLMQQLLTGKLRFPQFRPHGVPMRQTRFGLFPADWPDLPISEFASECAERHDGDSVTPVLSCTKHEGLVDSLSYFGKRVFSKDTSGYKVVRRGQFAYATNHVEEGSIGLLEDLDAGLVSPMYTVFKINTDHVHPPFLFALLKTELYRHIFEINTNASVNRRGSLRWNQFRTIRVALPTIEEQLVISACRAAAERDISTLRKKLDAMRQQKKGLMQKLLRGTIRVRDLH